MTTEPRAVPVYTALYSAEPIMVTLGQDESVQWASGGNNAAITFPAVSADWGTAISYATIWDDATGGRQIGQWTPRSGWVFYNIPKPRPWKIHQSRYRQRRRSHR